MSLKYEPAWSAVHTVDRVPRSVLPCFLSLSLSQFLSLAISLRHLLAEVLEIEVIDRFERRLLRQPVRVVHLGRSTCHAISGRRYFHSTARNPS